jgi:hypothetical protein
MTLSREFTWVIAPSFLAYEAWCGRHGILPGSGTTRYVRDANDLRGLRNVHIVCTVNWQSRSDWRELYNEALKAGRRPE